MLTPYLLIVAAYLLGALPTSLLVGKAYGIDMRDRGSGNLGGTNVYRVIGLAPALLVLAVDMLKGFLPVWFFPWLDGRVNPGWTLIYGLAAVVGHIWPVYTRFRGGKGVATAAGTMVALAPLAASVALLTWIGTLLTTRLASLASLLAVTLLPAVAVRSDEAYTTVLYALLIAGVVWWTHRENLVRLLRREELRLRFGRHDSSDSLSGEGR